MSAFADSSALVKLYADEEDHEIVRELDGIAVSVLARVEVPAALWRKARTDELDASEAAELVAAFEVDFKGAGERRPRFGVIEAGSAILEDATTRTAAHRLRAYDAVQLASALAARAADPECNALACFDDDLRDAAAANGFTLIP